MKNVLVFFPREKPMFNLNKGVDLAVLGEQLGVNIVYLSNKRTDLFNIPMDKLEHFESSWSKRDETIFFDSLYIASWVRNKNPALRHLLRVRILGNEPMKVRYLAKVFRNLFYKLRTIKFFSQIRAIKEPPEVLLENLRRKGIVSSNDRAMFEDILLKSMVDSVIICSTLKDATTYDLLSAAKKLSIPTSILVDSWDNIGTAPAIPDISRCLLLWSNQQLDEINMYFPEFANRAQIIGSTKRNDIVKAKKAYMLQSKMKIEKASQRSKFNILYIQAYFHDDSRQTLVNLRDIFKNLIKELNIDIKVTIRRYPFPSPSNKSFFNIKEDVFSEMRDTTLEFCESKEGDILQDILCADLVLSEISSGGLEAIFAEKPIIFIFSNHTEAYLTGKKILDFKFASDLLSNYEIVLNTDKLILKRTLERYLPPRIESATPLINEFHVDKSKPCGDRYFGEDFNLEKLKEAI